MPRNLLRRPRTVARSVIGASLLLATIVAFVLVLLLHAASSLRAATEQEARSKDVTAATLRVEKLVLDLETSLRGFVLTQQPVFLRPLQTARTALPRRTMMLERLVANDGLQHRRVRAIASAIAEYEQDYLFPMVKIARSNPAIARTPLAISEGEHRTNAIRQRFSAFLQAENTRARARARAAQDRWHQALAVGIGGLASCGLLIVVYGLYLVRAVARPIRGAAAGASRVASGDLAARLPERGPGEIGELTRAFNSMAASLESHRDELELQNERLRRSDAIKSDLVSTVSHEVRTPLASILGFSNVLLNRRVDHEERRRYLSIIEREARRLSDLVDDFLDIRRIEEGWLELDREPTDVGTLVEQQVQSFAAYAATHPMLLEIRGSDLTANVDARRLEQVVANLLSNAVKYSPGGGEITVTVEADEAYVRVSVRDSGIGMTPEQQEQVFTKFYRGEAAVRGIAGTGLGLAVAREIIEAHGGRIGFTSKVGTGSRFWFEIPQALDGIERPQQGAPTGAARGRPHDD